MILDIDLVAMVEEDMLEHVALLATALLRAVLGQHPEVPGVTHL